MQSTETIKDLLNLIEGFSTDFENALTKIQDPKIKSDIAAANLLRLLGNHIEGIFHLAHRGLYLLPSALVISRSVIETFGNLIWLIEPESSEERENRFIAILNKEKSENNRYASNLEELNIDISRFKIDNDLLNDHINSVKSDLSERSKNCKINQPHFKGLLKDIKEEYLYPLYCRFSQSVHSNHSATWIFHNEPNEYGGVINNEDWYLSLFVCRYTLIVSSEKFLKRFGGNPEEVITEEIKQEIKIYREKLAKPFTIVQTI
ncbi:DUF5677 domain-containing protein [Pseudanabaena sp. ABRG5-3]|uniref:DUF5677 domain-containing protein n=1 Tax=Pseudanabaena sp. ABRG5-3 TaxID=685565 RepID=UPI000DC70191|nr:DUF5677 domain-containing protein [Pseudanabaena sp. ABRG5-3]BBC22974.1 hypothetical protein ABRG53_0717 [Pseudanabaena sp. ABRG5-3]